MKTFDEIIKDNRHEFLHTVERATKICMKEAVKVALEDICNASNRTYITYIVSDEGYNIPVININAIMSVLEEMEA